MKSAYFSLACLLFIAHLSFAQSHNGIYMPIEFKEAYAKGTRSMDGTVASSYWQNRSVYKISATIDPARKLLTGRAVITYYNNSRDTIRRPTFHTYHDYYKSDSRRAGFFADGSSRPVTDGMVIESVMVNNESFDLKDEKKVIDVGTATALTLSKPLAPRETIELTIQWHYTIPGKGFERSGAIDSTSMFIAYWYPEMGVFDDIHGWDRVIYDAATEFYHDYSDYEVEITAPDNYMLWASVAPSNEQEVYSGPIRERIAKARKSTEPVHIFTAQDFRPTATGTKKWKYTARSFPDFSFALSDHFLWDAAQYKDQEGDFFVNAAYPPSHPEFASVPKTIGGAIQIFHTKFPVYPFPYNYFTIFNGLQGGGMEFPGMANDEAMSAAQIKEWTGKEVSDYDANLGLSLHEMTHMYFPFLMGINEKKYGWMDEGMANFAGFFNPDIFENDFDQPYLGSQNVVPIMVPSHIVEGSGINSYVVGSQSYWALYHLLGREQFLKSLHAYMNTWKHKHPTPYDFMFTFNRVSGQDLTWFWKRWYFDWGYMDLGLKYLDSGGVTVENVGGRPMPFTLKLTYADGTTGEEFVSPAVWRDASVYRFRAPAGKVLQSAALKMEGGDATKSNNTIKP